MRDQADILRVMAQLNHADVKMITVAGGKGGVGKSSIALNLAIALNRMEKRTLIIDADFAFSNIDIMLGVKTQYDLMDVIQHRKNIREVIEVGVEGVQFISGGSGVYELLKMGKDALYDIFSQVLSMDNAPDIIIFDTAAGISDNALRLIYASDQTLLVTTPEPTAVVDVYALIKIICNKLIASPLGLVVNGAKSVQEAQTVAESLTMIVKKNLEVDVENMGYILRDSSMQKAVQMQMPVLISFPKAKASADITALAAKCISETENPSVKTGVAGFVERLIGEHKTIWSK